MEFAARYQDGLVAETREQIDEAILRLARVGHETVTSYILFGDFTGDQSAIEQVTVNDADEYRRSGRNAQFIDVRRPAEYAAGHAAGFQSRPLDTLARDLEGLDPARAGLLRSRQQRHRVGGTSHANHGRGA